jgi:hypothetical protein
LAGPGRTRRATSAQDPESRPWHEGRLSNPVTKSQKDLRGGWYDAGENKYTSWAARYIIVLLHAYEEHPQAFCSPVNKKSSSINSRNILNNDEICMSRAD